MKEFLKVDLRIARQHSGLKGTDVATLLGVSRARLSKLENGYARPRVKELIGLALIYGKPLGELFQLSASRLTEKIQERSEQVEQGNTNTPKGKTRTETLTALVDRLQTLNDERYEA